MQKALDYANEIHGIMMLDVQTALSTVQAEVPLLDDFLKLPNVHLALDPEFNMKNNAHPGSVVGTMDASEINWVIDHLASLVKSHNLPPKVLVIHRFTRKMVTNYNDIKLIPEVQLVIDMDGWGSPSSKTNTYNAFITSEPVQFSGLKLFYKNDLKAPSKGLLTPHDVLNLKPIPSFIQYQ